MEAPDIAKRLLATNRAEEALNWLSKLGEQHWEDDREWIDLKIEALEQLDRKSEAQVERLDWFRKPLSLRHLRDYVKASTRFRGL